MSYDSRVRHADYTSNWFDAEIPGLGELGEGVRHGAFSPPTSFQIRPPKGLLRAHPECRPNFGRIHHGPALDHRVELADVADVRRGIAIDQDEVGQFPGRDRAEFVVALHHLCSGQSSHAQYLGRGDSGLIVDFQFAMQRVSRALVGAGHNCDAVVIQLLDHAHEISVGSAIELIVAASGMGSAPPAVFELR